MIRHMFHGRPTSMTSAISAVVYPSTLVAIAVRISGWYFPRFRT